jgi:hypothetical protein
MIHMYFAEGRRAYRDDVHVNPYTPGGEPYRSWEAGYVHEWFEHLDEENNE